MAIRADEVDLGRDRDLVERYQAGDPSAFDDLYQRYFQRLRGYCQRRVGDAHAAEEIAQEAFIRALGALPGFGGERRFYPWMTVIAQRLCVDHHRRHGRVTPVAEVDPGTVVDGEHDHVFHAVDVGHLTLAMDRLGPRHREVLKLREHEGWSYQQIADHLDVPMTTVEALLHRARKALRREFVAVAGDGRLATIPVLGWTIRSLNGLRSRLGERIGELSNLAAPVAASAMTVAFAVAPVVDGAIGHGDAPGPPLRTTPVVSVVDDPAPETTAVPAAAVAAPPETTVAPAPAPAGGTPSPQPPPARVGVAGGDVFVGPGGSGAAREESAGMSTTAEAGDLWVAAEPEALVPDPGTLVTSLGGGR